MARIAFEPDDRVVDIQPEETILDASLRVGIPHTHVCGGRARCSTCRVLVTEGLVHCPPRNEQEQVLAQRLQFPDNVRLACQTHPRGDLAARRLVLDSDDVQITSQLIPSNQGNVTGCEKSVAILFSDIRSFTTLSEGLYPYDVIHLLNRYFSGMLTLIEQHHGRVDNLIGDGIMAVFGEDGRQDAAFQAVAAGLAMVERAREFARYVKSAYAWEGFRIGVGIHYGTAVIGTVGAGKTLRQTAIGDTVNVASRVESANKAASTELLISRAVWRQVEDRVQTGRILQTDLKGKSGTFELFEVVGLQPPS